MKPGIAVTIAVLSIATSVACIDVGAINSRSRVDDSARPIGSEGVDGGEQKIVIASFEDGSRAPDDPRFELFEYYAYNPSTPDLPSDAFVNSPIVSLGYNSNYALELNWEVINVSDGQPGVGVRTIANGSVDLSAYTVFYFFQHYQHTGGCEAVSSLAVSLGCSQYNASVVGTVAMSTEGTANSLLFASFSQPPNLSQPPVELSDCLKVVDEIDFQPQVDLADGDCASGELILDSIEVRR